MTSLDAVLIALSITLWSVTIAVYIPRRAAEWFAQTSIGGYFVSAFAVIERGVSRVLRIKS